MAMVYILFAGIWLVIGLTVFILCYFSISINTIGNGILKAVLIVVFFCAAFLSIRFCVKSKSSRKKIIALILLTASTIAVNTSVCELSNMYASHYTKEKWLKHEKLRYSMIDDLEMKHDLTGLSEQAVIDLLGEPTKISEQDGKVFIYYIGDGMIDPLTYNISFENGIVTSFKIVSY